MVSELLQTFNPGKTEHNSYVAPKAAATTSGSQEGTCALRPTDNPLWDEGRSEAKRTARQTIHPSTLSSDFAHRPGIINYEGLRVGRSKRKPTTAPAPQPPPLCLLNALPIGVQPPGSQQITGRGKREKSKRFFFVCASTLV